MGAWRGRRGEGEMGGEGGEREESEEMGAQGGGSEMEKKEERGEEGRRRRAEGGGERTESSQLLPLISRVPLGWSLICSTHTQQDSQAGTSTTIHYP